MATIALRKYFQDIDSLINRERIDEAIAHCKHILRYFPKSMETYRLLGKAYLEANRYTEALDVFRRLLSAVPDDFIAHLGLSVIQEDAGNLDAAIWHMERAFETQPYKSTIQEELRRLYEKRDGSAPPKIGLTQGALARMYVKSGIYTQAIGEIRSALSKETYRPDLKYCWHACTCSVERRSKQLRLQPAS